LIDRQGVPLDVLARCAEPRGTRELAARVGEAMNRRRDLGAHQRSSIRVVYQRELRGQRLETAESLQIAEKLRGDTLVIDDRFGGTRPAHVSRETCPRGDPRALQV